jgi:hypothetical protein
MSGAAGTQGGYEKIHTKLWSGSFRGRYILENWVIWDDNMKMILEKQGVKLLTVFN